MTNVAKDVLRQKPIAKAFLAFQRAFNRLYAINSDYLMRVTLLVNPVFKTSSEVATLSFLEGKTSIPVPKVIAHSTSKANQIGFERMLMERVDNAALLADIWPNMRWAAKETLVKEVACDIGQLFNLKAQSIGSIFRHGPYFPQVFWQRGTLILCWQNCL